MNGYVIIGIAVGCLLIGFISGNRVTMWYEGYQGEKAAIHQANKAFEGETNIIRDTAKIQKVIIHEKTSDCGNAIVPAGVSGLLR